MILIHQGMLINMYYLLMFIVTTCQGAFKPEDYACVCINPFSDTVQPHLGDKILNCEEAGECYVACHIDCVDAKPAVGYTAKEGRCVSKAACLTPDLGTTDSEFGTADSELGIADPELGTTDPELGTTDPEPGTTDPELGTTDPEPNEKLAPQDEMMTVGSNDESPGSTIESTDPAEIVDEQATPGDDIQDPSAETISTAITDTAATPAILSGPADLAASAEKASAPDQTDVESANLTEDLHYEVDDEEETDEDDMEASQENLDVAQENSDENVDEEEAKNVGDEIDDNEDDGKISLEGNEDDATVDEDAAVNVGDKIEDDGKISLEGKEDGVQESPGDDVDDEDEADVNDEDEAEADIVDDENESPAEDACTCFNPFADTLQSDLGDEDLNCGHDDHCYVDCDGACGDVGPATGFTAKEGRCISKAACQDIQLR
eukprot:GFUD01033621.1.p1 GENE.GFUD01033621.1~~GFUD01033621.1.p1  ORF type:complete len:435 (-),score=149.94 GFUD01033621.1:61-1365(-)